ncbi:MAG: hypothetical protein RL513_1444 [Pseudomonadota bacterium]
MPLLQPYPISRPSRHFAGAQIVRAPHFGVREGRQAPGWGVETPRPEDDTSGDDREAALQSAMRHARQAGNALDAFGHACITLRASDGRMLWQTPLARDLLVSWYPDETARRPLHAPQPVIDWLQRHLADAARQVEPPCLSFSQGARRLTFRLHRRTDDEEADSAGDGEWLVVMREESDAAVIEAMSLSLSLTAREAEVLYWVVKGKINRDIAEIVGASPATVKKHLEHVYAKLGVETRTAAAGMAMDRIRQWQPAAQG